MNSESVDARRRVEEARRASLARSQSVGALSVELDPPDERILVGKSQLTIPARVRRRWTASGRDQVLTLVGIEFSPHGIFIIPRSRAVPWLEAPSRRPITHEISMQESGNFEIPKTLRDRWASESVVRLDLGYGYLLVTKTNVAALLAELRGGDG